MSVEDLKIAQDILVKAQVAGCTCGTKTPAIEFHEDTCTYRLAVEAVHLITLMIENTGGQRAPLLDLDTISDDAKWVAAAWFSHMVAGRGGGVGGLSFTYETTRPTDRAQRGLDELVEKGVLIASREPVFSPDAGKVTYRPVVDCGPAHRWAVSLDEAHEVFKEPLVEPVHPDIPMQPGIATFMTTEEAIR